MNEEDAGGRLTNAASHQELVAPTENSDRYIHSDVWDRLVRAPDDLPGIVAYGVYQQRKRQWISDCVKKDGCMPAVPDVKGFSFSFRDNALLSLREEAEGTLFRLLKVKYFG